MIADFANNVNPEQTALKGAVLSGFIEFAITIKSTGLHLSMTILCSRCTKLTNTSGAGDDHNKPHSLMSASQLNVRSYVVPILACVSSDQ